MSAESLSSPTPGDFTFEDTAMRPDETAPIGDPYLITGPAVISFSGGRTSGFLLKHIIDAHGGTLPANVVVCFANTGKEDSKTLDFVKRCGDEWGVPINWLEFEAGAANQTRVVDFDSASRNGEPFIAVVKSRKMLPNPVTRFCTIDLKIRRFSKFAHDVLKFERWTSVVGLRHDEPKRIAKLEPRNLARKDRWATVAPLDAAGVTKADVRAWWAAQSFDLGLPYDRKGDTIGGNCDLCFLKGRRKIEKLIAADPSVADWWIEQERTAPGLGKMFKPEMALFRADRPSYAAIRNHVQFLDREVQKRDARLLAAAEADDDEPDCACTD